MVNEDTETPVHNNKNNTIEDKTKEENGHHLETKCDSTSTVDINDVKRNLEFEKVTENNKGRLLLFMSISNIVGYCHRLSWSKMPDDKNPLKFQLLLRISTHRQSVPVLTTRH